jgi:hypothetical protein
MTKNQMYERAKQLWPQSTRMQRTWVHQTWRLIASGKHALQTGGWKNGTTS